MRRSSPRTGHQLAAIEHGRADQPAAYRSTKAASLGGLQESQLGDADAVLTGDDAAELRSPAP